MRLGLKIALLIAALLGLSACPKIPLRENRATFDLASSHWFELEKTQYVFFSISGLRTAQAKLTWPFAFEISGMGTPIPGLQAKADGFAALDLTKGVYQHHFVECGDGRICGSFSFHANSPIQQILVRFRYDAKSEMQEVASVPVATHPAGQGPDSQSALVYGVYNHDNSRLQMRVHDNFGTPDADQVLQYGMNRNFTVSGIQSVSLTTTDEVSSIQQNNGYYIFPAAICGSRVKSGKGETFTFGGHDGWTKTNYDPNEAPNDACFQAALLDQTGNVITSAPGMARKNPVLAGEPLTVQPPVKQTIDIPIIVSYCPDAPDGDTLTNPDFMRYQKFILGVPDKTPTDICFQTGQESQFRSAFAGLLDRKLNAAKTQSGSLNRDFFFRVIINTHNFYKKVRQFHQIMSGAIRAKISNEIVQQSPRLVGAFVYDSEPAPDVDIGGNVVWCPRDPDPNGTSDPSSPQINCTPMNAAGKVTLGPFNFRIPMGPFPTVDAFLKNFNEVGDRGEMNDPQLTVNAVHSGSSTITGGNGNSFYTFFDGQRLDFSPNERLKLCTDRDTDGLFNNMVFQYSDSSNGPGVMSLTDAQSAMLYPKGDTVGSMLVGLQWTNPFIGTFSYSIPVKGSVFTVIPISITGKTTQKLGDPVWSKPVWNLTPLMQKCVRNCEHPGFDESGVYQLTKFWNSDNVCTTPKTPEPGP